MKRKGLILLGIVLVFGTLVLWGLNRLIVPMQSRTLTLPDGTVLAIESISYGKKHVLRGRGNRLIDVIFPSRQLAVYQSQENALVLFLRQTPRSKTARQNSWSLGEIQDDAGGFSRGMYMEYNIQHPDHVRVTIPSFPRRGNWLTVTFHDQKQKPIGTMRFLNPASNPSPQRQPDTFPATQLQDGIALTVAEPKFIPYKYNHRYLFSQQSGYSAQAMAQRGLKKDEALCRRLTFSVMENGKPSRNWEIETASEEDIYGHRSERHIRAANSVVYWSCSLPSNENIGLKLLVQKRTSAPFQPKEAWSFAPIVPPKGKGQVTLPKVESLNAGVEFVGGTVIWAQAYQFTAQGYAVTLDVRGLPDTSRFVLEAKDENGKFVGNSYERRWVNNAPMPLFSQGKPSGVVRYTFILETQKPLKQLTLTARVLPGKLFHFTLPGTYKPPNP